MAAVVATEEVPAAEEEELHNCPEAVVALVVVAALHSCRMGV